MKKSFATLAFVALTACNSGSGPSNSATAALPNPDQIDKSCVLSASDRLRKLNGLSAADGRALPPPTGKAGERIVELDATNAGMKVTYVFACLYDPRTSMAFSSPMGRKS